MRVIMLNPPFKPRFSRTSRSPAVSKGGCVYYPIWMAYATGVLMESGHNVRLIDAPAENLDLKDVLKKIKKFQPGLCILDTSTASIHSDIRAAEEIKKETGCFVALVGTHVSSMPEWTLKQSGFIDAVCVHEYDFTVRDLARELDKKRPDLKKVDGLVFQQKGRMTAKIVKNKPRALIEDLDQLPFVSKVYKKFLNQKNYFYPANLFPEVTIVSGRGCPYRCTFCLLPQTLFSRAYRTRSVENVIEEIKYILKEFPKTKEIFFEDDTFTADKNRVRKFCDAIQEAGLKFIWSTNARADVDLETLKRMKEAGCRLLCVGVESGDQRILNNIHKGTTVIGIKRFMQDSKKAGVLVHGCFILGNQGETKETIRKTIEFAKELDPDTAQFFPVMVYPGTESFDYFSEKGYLTTTDFNEWVNEDGAHNTIVSRPGLSNKELVELCDRGRREFYLRPEYFAKKAKQAVTNPSEIPRLAKGSKTFFKHLVLGTKKKEEQ